MVDFNGIAKNKNSGITLISLVVTIIILLILAGISIGMLSGDNSIINQAGNAKTQTDIAEEKEILEQATVIVMGKSKYGNIEKTYLDAELNKYPEVDTTEEVDEGIEVTFKSSRVYLVDADGNVSIRPERPVVTHTINPETQVDNGNKVTINISATIRDGTISKIINPDGTEIKSNQSMFEVEENDIYTFIVEGSNGGTTTYNVEITNAKDVEKFSDIYTSTTKYTDKNEKTAWIPQGFAVGRSKTINTIQNGLVITDSIDSGNKSNGNEFVWIPVDNPDDMYGTLANGSLAGKLYDFTSTDSNALNWTETNGIMSITTTSGNGSYMEPAAFYAYTSNLSKINSILRTTLSNKSDFINHQTTQFENMIASIKRYKGFYIGRYENYISSDSVESKKDNTPTGMTDWYTFYAKQQLYNTLYVQSQMIWGCQYDQMLKWMQKNNIDVTSSRFGSTSILNIYGASKGGGYEVTSEMYWASRVKRSTSTSVYQRNTVDESGSASGDLSRMTIYIK